LNQFRSLMRIALIAGTFAGSVLFVYQYFVVTPRIVAAEFYEQDEQEAGHQEHHEWKPQNGFQRNAFTAASTILTGIGFAALLVSIVSLSGVAINVRHGALWGLAGFICFVAVPALGLPPAPPGVPLGDLTARQLWWSGTVVATAAGIFLMFRSRPSLLLKALGGLLVLLPHVIGAPKAAGPQVVPEYLVHEFAVIAIGGNGLFWIVLGVASGFLLKPERPSAAADRPVIIAKS
jgi:cobalt transporter subunit CbtA